MTLVISFLITNPAEPAGSQYERAAPGFAVSQSRTAAFFTLPSFFDTSRLCANAHISEAAHNSPAIPQKQRGTI